MAGITAVAVSASLVSGSTAPDTSVGGFVTNESIVLGVTGTPTTVRWSIAKPTAAGSRSNLDSSTSLTPTFTPDAEGYFTVTALLDGATQYVLRIAIAMVSAISTIACIRLLPVSDASVPAPATGRTIYYSATSNAMVAKKPDGTIVTFTVV